MSAIVTSYGSITADMSTFVFQNFTGNLFVFPSAKQEIQ